ncbi:hypothetical protein GGU11DRAFT_855704 [Lentinula aff. detonsa]|nr:hypothetical protein GGU11DRAFT_855704 [Lentinula aff. detonsa]
MIYSDKVWYRGGDLLDVYIMFNSEESLGTIQRNSCYRCSYSFRNAIQLLVKKGVVYSKASKKKLQQEPATWIRIRDKMKSLEYTAGATQHTLVPTKIPTSPPFESSKHQLDATAHLHDSRDASGFKIRGIRASTNLDFINQVLDILFQEEALFDQRMKQYQNSNQLTKWKVIYNALLLKGVSAGARTRSIGKRKRPFSQQDEKEPAEL